MSLQAALLVNECACVRCGPVLTTADAPAAPHDADGDEDDQNDTNGGPEANSDDILERERLIVRHPLGLALRARAGADRTSVTAG